MFRYRVSKAPSVCHSTSTLQARSMGWCPDPGRGWRGLLSNLGENVRNKSPDEKHASGAEQECGGWSPWTPGFP